MLGAACLVAVLALGLLVEPQGSAVKALPTLLLLAGLVAVAVRETATDGVGILSPAAMACLAYGVMFVVVPLTDLVFDHPLVQHKGWWTTAWLALAGFGCAYGGYRASLSRKFTSSEGASQRDWSAPVATVLSLALLALATVGVLLWVASVAGIENYVRNFGRRTDLFPRPNSLVLMAVTVAAPAVALQGATWVRSRSPLLGGLFVGFWLLPALLASGFAGQRWRDLSILVSLATVWHLGRRRVSVRTMAICLTVLTVGFIAWGQQRNVIGTESVATSLSGEAFYFNYVGSSHELAQFRDFMIAYEGVPTQVGYQYGATFLSVIPSAPFPTGGYLYSSVFYSDFYTSGTSVSTPLPGELYMNFGVPGIMIGMALYGAFIGAMENYYRRRRGRTGPLAIYSYSVLPVALVLRGDLTTFGGWYALGLAALVASVVVVERAGGRVDRYLRERSPLGRRLASLSARSALGTGGRNESHAER